MPLHRRDFMKLLGASVASLYLARCRPQPTQLSPESTEQWPMCYEATEPPRIETPQPTTAPARERLRLYWLRFEELAQHSREDTENKLGEELTAGHRAVLDELVANGEITASAAGLVQEAYDAAVYHTWRSNAPITCYIIAGPQYEISSANTLLEQATVLNQIAEQGTVNPATLAKAQSALEHDLAFYALTEEDVQSLYDQLGHETGKYPSFEELSLELTPEAKEATQFIIELLTGK